MNISGYGNSIYSNNIFANRTSISTSTFMSQIGHYNTLSKYAIVAKYGSTSHPNQVASTETTTSASKFLSTFDTNYSNLDKATTKLKSTLTATEENSSDIVAATKNYVAAYNSTTKFLDANSNSNTTRLNTLKASNDITTTVSAGNLASIGIQKATDGTLKLDEKKLSEALATNNTFAKRTLSSTASRTEVSTKMATNTVKSTLITEQNKALATKSSEYNNATYEDFMKLAKNPRALGNYYCSLATLGIFMDISL
ncbi:hypothetical protein [Cellulosilyticum ruminicola]|uniref:hypothetical protein n=1 Tax=Cellulosilyticum ruminicola TaxID=425254 RepID=UPI0006D0669B|nr:hypothetical protein [Cellulosilyticum ruminicola]